MPSGVEPFVGKRAAKDLQRHVAVGTREGDRPEALPLARPAIAWRTDEHIAEEGREVGDDHAAAPPRHSIPQHEGRRCLRGLIPRAVRVVADERVERPACDLPRDDLGVGNPSLHTMGHIIRRAAADGVVEL